MNKSKRVDIKRTLLTRLLSPSCMTEICLQCVEEVKIVNRDSSIKKKNQVIQRTVCEVGTNPVLFSILNGKGTNFRLHDL